jgi:hypothetical protein
LARSGAGDKCPSIQCETNNPGRPKVNSRTRFDKTRNGQCRIGWQSEQCAEEDKAALECTQRSRQHERCGTNAGAKAFEDKRIDHAEGLSQSLHHQPHFTRVGSPSDQTQNAGVQHDRPGPVCCHDYIIDRRCAAGERGHPWCQFRSSRVRSAGAAQVVVQSAVLLVHPFARFRRQNLRRLR